MSIHFRFPIGIGRHEMNIWRMQRWTDNYIVCWKRVWLWRSGNISLGDAGSFIFEFSWPTSWTSPQFPTSYWDIFRWYIFHVASKYFEYFLSMFSGNCSYSIKGILKDIKCCEILDISDVVSLDKMKSLECWKRRRFTWDRWKSNKTL